MIRENDDDESRSVDESNLLRLISDVWNDYEVLAHAGAGATSTVYRAKDRAHDRMVAVKIGKPDVNLPIGRFVREHALVAGISSAHVVHVFECRVLRDNRPALVMEWVDGQDLGKILQQAQHSLEEACVLPWMLPTAKGMRAAEEHHVVHRDLKPSNILIDRQQNARVSDFGLARPLDAIGELTYHGQLMGTPLYMAPEQAEDPRRVDIRADIYSYGATFYHALTGAPPFQADSIFSVLFKHKMEPLVSPCARNPAISSGVSDLLERCLAKSPADRFSSFSDVVSQLRPDEPVSSPWDEISGIPDARPYLERYYVRRQGYLADSGAASVEDCYQFADGRSLLILRGDITHQNVDVLVSSDDADLSMGLTHSEPGVAGALVKAGGNSIAAEARRFAPVRRGRVIVTSAGELPARFIFHGITLGSRAAGRTQNTGDLSRDLILELMTSCLYHADTLNIRSIAFPLFGSGSGGYYRGECLDTMFRFLVRTFLRGITSLREAHIVVFPDSRPAASP